MLTRKTIKDFHDFLKKENFYSRTREQNGIDELNEKVNENWKAKIEDAIAVDFKRILNNSNLQIRQEKFKFEIRNMENHGATTYKSFLTITDNQDKMDVVIDLIVNVDNSFIYLGSSHTDLEKYNGTSKPLRRLFTVLRHNEKIGHFYYTKFYQLDSSEATATNKMFHE